MSGGTANSETGLPGASPFAMVRNMAKFILPALAATLFAVSLAHADIAVKSGDRIAFLGDSITQLGNSNPIGYVNLVPAALRTLGIDAVMQARLQAATDRKGNLLTVDGVHLNAAGNELFAETILRAFGATDEQVAKARLAWRDIPGARSFSLKLSLNEAEQFEAKAKEAGLSVEAYLRQLVLGK